jgi:hypothetical protein
MLVSGDISTDVTWSSENTYVLDGLVFVTGGTLTIEAGTQIFGKSGSALIVTQDGHIDANGTADAPIVFTSDKPDDSRRRGDWGGVALLGRARINLGTDGRLEGIASTDARGAYGGDDDDHDCGTLRYVRIEYAGFELSTDNELNGLTVAGCGADTTLDFIHVHMGDDDGIEFFGGSANLKHALITGAADDSIDWDEGYRGKMQFIAVQQHADESDAAFESDNLETNNDATPRSMPTLYNVTLIGPNDAMGQQRAMVLRRGTWAHIGNILIMGFGTEAIDVRDESTVNGMMMEPPQLAVRGAIFYEIGADGTAWFADEPADGSEDDDDGGFVEADHFMMGDFGNRFDVDPMIEGAYDEAAPRLVPAGDSPAADDAAAPPSDGFFDGDAEYVGAFEPGGDDWTSGWTSVSTR